jgi:predicted O-methyltransferase YrrM
MTQDIWTAVDRYYADLFIPDDPALSAALADSEAAGLPAINVAPNQGKLLMLLAQMMGARNLLEIGTLGGYSTIWLGRALPPEGRIITLEYEPKHAAVAARNLERAGLSQQVEVKTGAALDTLPTLVGDPRTPFDLVFIDADKVNTAAYFEWALRLTRPGSVIIVDNVVRKGAVADTSSTDVNVQGIQRFNQAVVAAGDRVTATTVQTVGGKGYDGLTLVRVAP